MLPVLLHPSARRISHKAVLTLRADELELHRSDVLDEEPFDDVALA